MNFSMIIDDEVCEDFEQVADQIIPALVNKEKNAEDLEEFISTLKHQFYSSAENYID